MLKELTKLLVGRWAAKRASQLSVCPPQSIAAGVDAAAGGHLEGSACWQWTAKLTHLNVSQKNPCAFCSLFFCFSG